MKINAAFEEAVALRTDTLGWSSSPMPGVERRMLDRIGGEIARATSIVRYAPGSAFSAHTHSGGEEFIVLEGVFQDEHGDYPTGTYVRNPVGTQHVPRSDKGCTIFVKLWQFATDDQRQFSLNLNAVSPAPLEDLSGIAQAVLHDVSSETVLLEEWQPGVARSFADVDGAEIFVLDGAVEFECVRYGKFGWIRLPVRSRLTLRAGNEGARLWVKTGHLRSVSAPGT